MGYVTYQWVQLNAHVHNVVGHAYQRLSKGKLFPGKTRPAGKEAGMVAVAGKVSALCTSQMSHTVDTYLKLKPFGHVRLAHVSIGDTIWLVMAVKAGGRQHAREARRGRGQDTVEKCMIAKTYACTKSEKAAELCTSRVLQSRLPLEPPPTCLPI